MNIFTKFKLLILTTMLLSLITAITTALQSSLAPIFVYITFVFAVITFIISYFSMNAYSKFLVQTNDIVKKVASGSLYHRITNINGANKLGELCWSINNLLDQVETFNRDTSSSLKSVTSGNSLRRMLPDGLHGDFVTVSNEINEALEAIAVAQSKDQFIQEMIKTLNEYSSGSYMSKLDLEGMQADIIQLAKGINNLGDALSSLSQTNLKNGLALQQGSNVLARNVQTLSSSANNQAASLEETAAALEEITGSMRMSTENTTKMAQYAQEVTSSVKEGELLANKTASSMEEINEQTSSINEAIIVIDQIAFQTNILSLNAAVEAATAGESGKGFAVVAQEVRNLASRSAEAAKEIKNIVESATSKANEGKLIASNMIKGYNKLNENISLTITLIQDVSDSSKEQEEGIIQINDAVATIDQQIQESASVAHETNIVAQQSHDIAEKIVSEANKEFEGKDDIKIRKNIIDPEYKGTEKRSIERRIKNNEF